MTPSPAVAKAGTIDRQTNHRRSSTPMLGMSRPRFAIVTVWGSVVLTVLLWYWTTSREQLFDSIRWQEESHVKQGARLGMADSLVAHRTLLGKTRSEVVELLGEPPPTEYFRDWDLVYWLGPERGFISIDSEWLVLRLAEDGRVQENRIVRD
jgi:hypothetical protein